jgi:hypothetical protein
LKRCCGVARIERALRKSITFDHNGQRLACVYFEEQPGWRAAAHLLTRDKARRSSYVIRRYFPHRQPLAMSRGYPFVASLNYALDS